MTKWDGVRYGCNRTLTYIRAGDTQSPGRVPLDVHENGCLPPEETDIGDDLDAEGLLGGIICFYDPWPVVGIKILCHLVLIREKKPLFCGGGVV